MTKDHAEEAFSLACKVFVEGSVLHAAMDISVEEYRRYMEVSFNSMLNQALSLVALNTSNNEIVGCLVACDYLSQNQQTTIDSNIGSALPISAQDPQLSKTTVPDKLKPVNAILDSLDEIYRKNRQLRAGQCMLVDMAVVTHAERGQGIYRKLREAAHRVGKDAGFSLVVGELSSAATQRLCVNRFKHKVCAEIEYSEFAYNGDTPFASINIPNSILLVEGEL